MEVDSEETMGKSTALLTGKAPPRNPTDLTTIPAGGSGGGLEWHNFTGDKMGIWRFKALAQSTADRGSDFKGEIFPLTYWYVQQVQVLDDASGEYIDSFRVVLMSADTRCISFVSAGILKSLQSMVEAIGAGPYDPPVNVAIHESNTRKGRRVYSIVPE